MSEGTVYGETPLAFPLRVSRRQRRETRLIHFAQPIGDLDNPRGQAQHYLGWALNLAARMDAHAAGNGARLMEVITEAGIDWRLVRTWSGDRDDERRLKGQHNAPRLCPICNPEGWWRQGSNPPDRRH